MAAHLDNISITLTSGLHRGRLLNIYHPVYGVFLAVLPDQLPTIRFIWESGDALALTAEQRRLLAEYYALLNGDKELEVYVACYERGMRDCLSLLARLGLVSNVE